MMTLEEKVRRLRQQVIDSDYSFNWRLTQLKKIDRIKYELFNNNEEDEIENGT